MQAKKIRYDVIGLTETKRHRPLNATFDTGGELFLGTCDSRGVSGVGVLVNTNLVMNIDSSEQQTTRIGHGFWEDADVDNIDEEYNRLVQHLRDSVKRAEGSRATKTRLSHETLERGPARAAGNHQLTSELAKRCKVEIKEHPKERRAAVLAEAVEAGKSIPSARRDFANRNTKM
ncbi:hypothetical protein ANCDUO_18600 [Ancylostoma duodenale]|uniref:Uncharacterized protein n=1 Tax=Ancylostoma duodenale TaxID=51022 RepID=A0A0C2FRW3_9BILA|nr:hypothetical protein ANCDUO_18600 [Ancylostoma duodenale]